MFIRGRGRLCLTAAVAIAVGVGSTAYGVNPRYLIHQTSIGGAELSMRKQDYKNIFGLPVRTERLEGGLTRLHFETWDLDVYFRGTSNSAIGIVTWAREFRTSRGVGPCSSVRALRRAYGSKLKPFRFGGRVVAYRLGRLWFEVEDGRRVGSVELTSGKLSVFAALNSPRCGEPGA